MSETYYEKYSKYYDTIHIDKDYEIESNLINKYSTNKNSLLDVGCGTANHSIILSEYFKKIVGVDLSKSMLNEAKKKIDLLKISNVELTNSELCSIDGTFDTIISMFNVVNHIQSLEELSMFFEDVKNKLNEDGIFIFDCWNGTACRMEMPTEYHKKFVNYDWYTLELETNTTSNLFDAWSLVETKVNVYSEGDKVDEFKYGILHKLWTPDILKSLIEISGMKVVNIVPSFNDEEIAKANDYRITFISKKQKNA
jgi:2-polyprenyl-3-methyl-5-hydroxy-6-metoxy-1,4-benzoquinol methylase